MNRDLSLRCHLPVKTKERGYHRSVDEGVTYTGAGSSRRRRMRSPMWGKCRPRSALVCAGHALKKTSSVKANACTIPFGHLYGAMVQSFARADRPETIVSNTTGRHVIVLETMYQPGVCPIRALKAGLWPDSTVSHNRVTSDRPCLGGTLLLGAEKHRDDLTGLTLRLAGVVPNDGLGLDLCIGIDGLGVLCRGVGLDLLSEIGRRNASDAQTDPEYGRNLGEICRKRRDLVLKQLYLGLLTRPCLLADKHHDGDPFLGLCWKKPSRRCALHQGEVFP